MKGVRIIKRFLIILLILAVILVSIGGLTAIVNNRVQHTASQQPVEKAELDTYREAYQEPVFEDEFDGSGLDDKKWTSAVGISPTGGRQNYTEPMGGENLAVSDGCLCLTVEDARGSGLYTATAISTQGKATFTYGRFEVTARMPSAQGAQASILLCGQNPMLPADGSTHMFTPEDYIVLAQNDAAQEGQMMIWQAVMKRTEASPAAARTSASVPLPADEEFHTYGLIWTEHELVWYVDDAIYNRFSLGDPEYMMMNSTPYYLVLDVAADMPGCSQAQAGLKDSIAIDSVRVYQ